MAEASLPLGVDGVVRVRLESLAEQIEQHLKGDAVAIYGPILHGIDDLLRRALESLQPTATGKLVVLLNTAGGVVEVVERMVEVIRHHYKEVICVIPDRAMSAGTVFAMSGDAIMMDYFSRLGPIDPQIVKDGRLVPALSYLVQFKRLIRKAQKGQLSDAEFALLARFDLAEIHQYEQARNLTKTLIRKWLATYKFKNWFATETRGQQVDDAMREKRADEFATSLSNSLKWHSHGRGISMQTLQDELKLKIDDFSEHSELSRAIREYHQLLADFVATRSIPQFVHTRKFF